MRIYSFKYLGKFSGITLAPFGAFIDPRRINDKAILNHERIHWKQQFEMFILPFYIWYIIEWMFKGYRNISFEREAYLNEHNLEYLKSRKRFAWVKFIRFPAMR